MELREFTEPKELEALQSIASWLCERTGIHYPNKKLVTLKHKLFKICLDQHMTIEEIAEHLLYGNGSFSGSISPLALKVVAVASTNHTAFFREPVWDTFRDILTRILASTPRVRIWSAAASSGEEAYTIAMVAAEILGLDAMSKRIAILGTDINFQVLKQAEEGIYHPDRLAGLDESLKKRYFQKISAPGLNCAYRIHDSLKAVCLFRRMNLKKRPYPFKNRFNIIFSRNILYYFTPEEREAIVNELYRVTERGGYLFVSVTESLTGMSTPWRKVPGNTGIYRKEQ